MSSSENNSNTLTANDINDDDQFTKKISRNDYQKSPHNDNIRKNTAQKIKFSIKDFFSKCDQIRSLFFRFKDDLC